MQLHPIKFEYNESDPNIHLGFIAQDIESIIPELVSEDGGFKCLSSTELIPVLVNAIKEMYTEIETLKSQIHI